MTGRKDTKTGLWMLPLTMDESTISPAAASMISQEVASDVLQPIAATAHQRVQGKPNLHANNDRYCENNAFLPLTVYCRNTTRYGLVAELLCNLTPTTNMEELTKYHHQSVCSPTKSALLRGIANLQFRTFPGLTYELIKKHLPPSTATDKGHMIRQ